MELPTRSGAKDREQGRASGTAFSVALIIIIAMAFVGYMDDLPGGQINDLRIG